MLWNDFETFSEVPITHGTYKYVENCEPLLYTFAFDDDEPACVDFTAGEKIPHEVLDYLENSDGPICAHNSMFDRNVFAYALDMYIPIPRWRDPMVKALAHALPGKLDLLCDILKIGSADAKHKNGKKLIQLFCKPRPKNSGLRRATRETHPTEWEEFKAYALADIPSMRAVYKRLPDWNYKGAELDLWHRDQEMNDRGFLIDLPLVDAALEAVADAQALLKERTLEATEGAVSSATKRDALIAFIFEAHGIPLPDLQGATIERRLNDPDIPEPMKELLRIRLQTCTTSTSKYKSLKRATNSDGRLRGTIQFDGASRTRRAAGRTFQPQNLPSRGLLKSELIDSGIDALKAGVADIVFDDVMKLTSSTIRGTIIAPRDKKLVIADKSNIEGRMLAWSAQEDWKLQAFRDFDNGTGPDQYALAYAKSFGISAEEVMDNKENGDGSMRQIGKVQEVMLGYQGNVGAFVTGAAIYGIDLEAMAEGAVNHIPEEVWEEAIGFYDWAKEKGLPMFGLSKQAYSVCNSFTRLWRYAHPNTTALWKGIEETAITAVYNSGNTYTYGRFKLRKDGAWLRIQMPSGRVLCYPSPKVEDGKLSYMGVNQYTRKWSRLYTYGGKLVENICQSESRDDLYDDMPAVEEAGYKIVLHVHDELITETPDSPEFNAEELGKLMSTNHSWNEGLPLAAAGFETYRYRKG